MRKRKEKKKKSKIAAIVEDFVKIILMTKRPTDAALGYVTTIRTTAPRIPR